MAISPIESMKYGGGPVDEVWIKQCMSGLFQPSEPISIRKTAHRGGGREQIMLK
jgi:hypothetical protein